jgi:4-amino-4-deoxy-L-arabinose transferase-like glycosyltransferase
MQRAVVIALALILVGSAVLHAHRAANPTRDYQSADERSYGQLAIGIAEDFRYGRSVGDPLHWPPGAPMLFAIGHRLAPGATDEGTTNLGSAYWLQALVSLGTVLAACLLAWALAGPWAAVVAAALVGFYPPLILATGEQLSEPLGAFFVTAGFAALALRQRFRGALVVAGALWGLAILTRADLLLAPFLIAAVAAGWLAFRQRRPRRAAGFALKFAGVTAVVLAPWVLYASLTAGKLVPVTSGSPSALFVGTYLPGDGTTFGMKRALGVEAKRMHPELRDKRDLQLSARSVLDVVAARHPDLPRNEAIQREARRNLTRYGLGEPLAFGGMMATKSVRMWSRYARGGARHTSTPIRVLHVVLVVAALAGLLAGAWRRRDPVLLAVLLVILYSTALHSVVVSQARYNLPLMPALLAAGVAGWFLAVRRRPESEPATLPEWTSDRSESGTAAVKAAPAS